MTALRRNRRWLPDRGVTLVELMVGLVLGNMVAVFMLMITRSQLASFEQTNQLVRAQQNVRAGVSYLERVLRSACSGNGDGRLAVNVGQVVDATRSCLQVWDGARLTGGTFTTGTTDPDAIEVVYPLDRITAATAASLNVAAASVTVQDATGFAAGDFVLLTDLASNNSLFQIQRITTTTAPAATFTLTPTVGAPQFVGGAPPPVPFTVMRAASIAIYAAPAGSSNPDMLMLDPDGMAGLSHTDAQPLIDGLQNFQVAVAIDGNADGTISDTGGAGDEWFGNATGELPLPAAPWNGAGNPQLRMVRFTLMVKTSNSYPGAAVASAPLENGVAPTPDTLNPRYRTLRLQVAPRMWTE